MSEDREQAEFDPTVHRLLRARQHGFVPYSRQLAIGFQFVVAIGAVWTLTVFGQGLLSDMTSSYWQASTVRAEDVSKLPLTNGLPFLGLLFATLSGVMLLAMASHLAQKGFIIPQRQLFDISHMNPFGRPQRLTLAQRIGDMGIRMLQISILIVVTFAVFQRLGPEFLDLWFVERETWFVKMPQLVFSSAMYVAVSYFVLTSIDYGIARLRYWNRLKMTPQEFREELKESELPQHVKNAQRKRRDEIAFKSRMMSAVPLVQTTSSLTTQNSSAEK
ncbi:MAG: EscU/YscU/HrcU family type III secretion system export apparatus switch protein [Pirellulaceae bacterium]